VTDCTSLRVKAGFEREKRKWLCPYFVTAFPLVRVANLENSNVETDCAGCMFLQMAGCCVCWYRCGRYEIARKL
jgi:hypothetical protein